MSRAALGAVLVVAVASASVTGAQPAATERIELVVEVIDRDQTPVIPCGTIGAQPRAVNARVISVESGTFDEPTVHLMWPMCELSHVDPGARFRIRIVRRVGVTPPGATYRVRWSAPVPAS